MLALGKLGRGSRIFLSYRRQDSAHQTGRIYDRLVPRFGEASVFKDVDSIPLGVDFRTYLAEKVQQCDVLLAVIGDHWLSDRLHDPADFVRIEIELGLARGIPVIPLLVGSAPMPRVEQLPESLKQLAFRNATLIRPDPDFHRDMDRLIASLERHAAERGPTPPGSQPDTPLTSLVGKVLDSAAPVLTEAGQMVEQLVTTPEGLLSARASPSGSALAARRKNVILPPLPPGRERPGPAASLVRTWRADASRSLAFSPDGQVLATGGSNEPAVRLWGVPEGSPVAALQGHRCGVYSVAFSPDGQVLASAGGNDKTIRLWSVPDQKPLADWDAHKYPVNSVAFSPDGKLLASGGSDSAIRLWGLPEGKALADWWGHDTTVTCVAFSPDGGVLASGGGGTVRLSGVPDGGTLNIFGCRGDSPIHHSVAFSPDGSILASGGQDQTVRLWGVPDGKPLAVLQGHGCAVFAVAFTPDGKLLASGGEDGSVRLWDAAEGKLLATLQAHEKRVGSLAFSPRGNLLATGDDGTVRLWLRHTAAEACDMSPGQPDLPPRAKVSLVRGGDGVVYPGDLIWWQTTVGNTGKGDLIQTWAEVRSDLPALHGMSTVLGRIKAGEKVERCQAVVLPVDTPPGPLELELVFHEANGYAPQFLPLRFTVRPLPRPDLPLRWQLINDGSGNSSGEGDGQPRRGESIDVVVRIENQTGENLDDLFLTLKDLQVPAGVAVNVPRCGLDPLPDGRSVEGRVTFSVKPQGGTGPAKFELRLESLDGRTFAVVPVETTID